MGSEGPATTWTAATADLLVGPRGIVKAIHVWWPLSLCLTVYGIPAGPARWAMPLAAFGAAACWAEAAILCNDFADRREDAAARKSRWIGAQPAWAAYGAVAGLALVGLALIRAGGGGPVTGAVYLAAVALALAYSVRPLRMKTRGPWGLAAYSGSACLAYAVFPWAWVGAPAIALAAICPAVFMDKWVNIHFHQVIDCEADAAAGTRTFAVAAGAGEARAALLWAAVLASVAMVGGVACSAVSAGAWGWAVAAGSLLTVAGMAAHVTRARRRPERTALVEELPWHYLGLTFALFRVVPAVLMLRLALHDPAMRGAAALLLVLLAAEARHLVGYRYR